MPPHPKDRPPLDAPALIKALDAHDVTWLLAGSYVLKLHGADITPNDLDVVLDRDPANLHRAAECLEALEAVPQWVGDPKWDVGTVEDHIAWRPWPADIKHLDQLFVTHHGMFDLPFALVPPYDTLLPGSTVIQVGGVDVTVCDPRRVLRALETRNRKKDARRATIYAEMRRRFGLD